MFVVILAFGIFISFTVMCSWMYYVDTCFEHPKIRKPKPKPMFKRYGAINWILK